MNYQGSDIYCNVIIPRKDDITIIEETSRVLAYHHTKPHWDTHIIVIPKDHVLDLVELSQKADGLARELLDVVAKVADKVRKEEGGCTIFTTIGNNQQSKHLHIHIHNGNERS